MVTVSDSGAPAAPDKRTAILNAAAEVFFYHGYAGAGMDRIARAAGVSKQTVYAYFGSKDELFEAIVRAKCDDLTAPLAAPAPRDEDPETVLAGLARRYLSMVLAHEAMAHFRVILSEVSRFPKLAEAFYRSGPQAAVTALSGYLARLAAAGRLRIDDPEAAAKLFFSLLRGDLYIRCLLGLGPAPDAEALTRAADQAVSVFLAAHRPEE